MVLQNKEIFRRNLDRVRKLKRPKNVEKAAERESVDWSKIWRGFLISWTVFGITVCGSSFFGYSGKQTFPKIGYPEKAEKSQNLTPFQIMIKFLVRPFLAAALYLDLHILPTVYSARLTLADPFLVKVYCLF